MISYQEVASYLAEFLQPEHRGVGDDPDGVGHKVNPLHGVVVLALVEDQPDQVYEREQHQGGRQDGLAIYQVAAMAWPLATLKRLRQKLMTYD